MQRLVTAFVTLVLVLATIPAMAENRWTDVSADPYKKSPALALKLMKAYGLNTAKAEDIAKAVSEKRFVKGELKKGEEAIAMIYGDGKVMKNPLMDWKGVNVLETEDYDAGEFIVRRAVICGNWLLTRKPVAELPPRPELPALRAVAMEVKPLKVLAQYLWLKDDHTSQLAFSKTKTGESGRNSRTIGPKLFDKHGKPTSPLYLACEEVPFEFLNVDFARARGKTVWVNGIPATIPADFSAGRSAFPIRVCKGLGEIGLGPDWEEWIGKNAVLRLHGDNFRDKLVYPPRERPWLETCVREADSFQKCGRKWEDDGGELYKLLTEHDRSRFHMKVRE